MDTEIKKCCGGVRIFRAMETIDDNEAVSDFLVPNIQSKFLSVFDPVGRSQPLF